MLSNMDFDEESSAHHLFLCPKARFRYKDKFHEIDGESCNIIDTSCSFRNSGVRLSHLSHPDHYVFPLPWCNNKVGEGDVPFCSACCCKTIGTDCYICDVSNAIYHKECVEAPSKIKHPLHSKHPLQLIKFTYRTTKLCYCCGQSISYLIYYCSVCNFSIFSICAQKPLRLTIDHPKRHAHTLTLFPRQGPLTCSTCGLDHYKCSFYICAPCDFVVHVDCIYLPWVIRISRHPHRLSYTSSLPSGEWSCGVCRQKVDEFCGEYSCNRGCAYGVHSKCATRNDIWDGKELEGIPEEFDEVEDERPLFEKIGDKLIRHFGHEHHILRLDEEVNRVYNEKKICQGCVVPIYEVVDMERRMVIVVVGLVFESTVVFLTNAARKHVISI
ncbi:PREDICTED: uncharacterized protein LOC104756751 [Camelina sativa]|uniref:Uncharacterized protein LOC104756751 n=1 Tax=Camelina sativa TaxID=90675 RepID=A0ABM0WXT1_CAMSA|nr:PREDICTED: uncharacterized protein LOC104756751 [Camelina sativa]